jgi:hypothetical protein
MNNKELLARIELLESKLQSLESGATIPKPVEDAMRDRLRIDRFEQVLVLPDGLFNAPLSSVTPAAGGATVDTQARTAVNTIIARLQSLGLIS